MTEGFTPEKNDQKPRMTTEEWKAMKDKEKADVYSLLDKTTQELAEVPGSFERYLDTQARMNRYTVSNALLISAQFPEATKLRTFAEWEAEGATIKKGSKSISILEPSEFQKNDGSKMVVYNVKKVFDITQTSKENEARVAKSPDLKNLIAVMLDTCPVTIDLATEIPAQNTAAYFDKDQNTLYVQKEGGDASYVCQCVARELGQVEASRNREDYDRNNSFAEAVITGYLICRRYGVPTDALDVRKAASVFKGMDAKSVRKELSRIRSYAYDINNNISTKLYQSKASRSKGNER